MASFKRFLTTSCIALFLAFPALPGNAQTLGQLFTSPEERSHLDQLRQEFLERTAAQGFDIQAEGAALFLEEEEQQNVQFSLEGIVQNRLGIKTIWLNGTAISESDLPSDVDLVQLNDQDVLRIRTSAKTHYLKAGQTLNLTTGEQWESFQQPPEVIEESTETASDEDSEEVLVEEMNNAPNQGVVAITDLIQALQLIQSNSSNNSSTTDDSN